MESNLKKFNMLVVIFLIGILLLQVISSRDFIIHNSSNTAQTYFIINGTTTNVDVTGNVTSSWFKGIFNWIIGATSSNYLSFNGTQLNFDESALNATIGSFGNGTYIKQDGTNSFTGNFDAGNINFSVGTSDFFVDNNNGRVGVGTVSPQALLNLVPSGNDGILLGDGTNSFYNLKIAKAVTEAQAAAFEDYSHIYTTAASGATEWPFTEYGALVLESRDNTNSGIALRTGDGTGMKTRIAILESGDVGIGTPSPVNKLDVEGGVVIGATYSGASTAPSNGLLVQGNVGIGTTSPNAKLQVVESGSGDILTAIQKADNTNGNTINLDFVASSSYNPSANLNYGGRLRYTRTNTNGVGTWDIMSANSSGNPISRLTISGGNVGIGTTSPQNTLNVLGDGNFTGDLFVNGANITGDYVPYTGATSNLDLGANNLSVNTNTLFVDSNNGRVGVGTTSPASLLQLNNGGTFTKAKGLTFGDGDTGIYESSDDTIRFFYQDSDRIIFEGDQFKSATSNGWSLQLGENPSATNPTISPDGTDKTTGLGTTGANQLALIAGGVNVMNLYNTGNVGIGTTAPSQKLDVEGNITSSAQFLGASGSVSAPTFSFSGDTDMGLWERASNTIGFAFSGQDRWSMTGNVFANIVGTGNAYINGIGTTAAGPAYTFTSDTDTGMFRSGANAIGFSTNGTEKVRIDGSGNVGIGTTNPQTELDVVGDANITGTVNIGNTGSVRVDGNGDMIFRI